MKKNIFWLFVLIIFGGQAFGQIGLGDILEGGQQIFSGLRGISVEEEGKIGREMAANLCARFGLYESSPAWSYVWLVGKSLTRQIPETRYNYHFAILNTAITNAFSAPGGYVFITVGLLAQLKDEAELAAVLGHEIGHIEKRHVAREMEKSKVISGTSQLAKKSLLDNSNRQLVEQLSGIGVDLLFKGFSRGDEFEADAVAIELLKKTGYDAAGLKRVLQRLSGEKSDSPIYQTMFRTHPFPQERIKKMETLLDYSGGVTNSERFSRLFPLAK